MHQSRLRIITVEDPPERVIPGATQVPVVRKRGTAAGDEFSFAIRGALRCDPDTLMVGEIRDLQSAVLAIKFAQSGHRVYTTVHASTALGIVGRLVGVGVDSTLAVHAGCSKRVGFSDPGAAALSELQNTHRRVAASRSRPKQTAAGK